MEVQWSLVLFAALSAWGAGTYAACAVFSGLLGWAKHSRKPALVLAAAALVVGAVASMTHLGHLDRIFGVLANPGSGIFVEGLSAALLVAVILVWLVSASRGASDATIKGIAATGLAPAVVLTVAVGSSYLMASKPAWNVAALPLLSVGTAASLGALTFYALAAAETESAVVMGKMRRVALATVVIQAVLVCLYAAMVAGAGYQSGSREIARMLTGDLAPLFWGGVVLMGVGIPFAAVLWQGRSDRPASDARSTASPALLAAVVCLVLAAVAFRVVMFSMGSSIISFGF